MKIIQSPRVKRDIQGHYTYIGFHDVAAAERFLDAINRTFARLAKYPDIGSTRLWNNPSLRGIRAWPVVGFDSFIIYYERRGSSRLWIARILHSSVQLEGVLRTPTTD